MKISRKLMQLEIGNAGAEKEENNPAIANRLEALGKRDPPN